MQNLLQNMMDSVSLAQAASDVTFQVLTGGLDVPVIHEGQSIPTLATRVRDYLIDAIGDGDLDGKDGISIEELYINEDDGHLMVRLTGQSQAVSLGKIVPEDGIGIKDAEYDEETGHLDFILEDDTRIAVGNIRGNDGYQVYDAYVRGSNLYIATRDHEGKSNVLDAGDISRFGGISANDVEIKEDGNLTVIFSDGTTRDLGRVVGRDGERGPSVQSAWLNPNGQLQFLRSDGTQFATNAINVNILDGTGNTIEDIEYDEDTGKLRVKLSADNDWTELGVIKGKDGRDGKDGVQGDSVESVTIEDGEIYVKLTKDEAARSVGNAAFYEAGDNSLQLTQARVIDDEESEHHKMLEITLDINGVESTTYLGPVIGEDGKDGKVITDARISEDNGLVLTDEDGNEFNAGEIPQGRIRAIEFNESGIVDVYEDEEKTKLMFSLSGPQIKGRDGINGFGITDIRKSDDESQIIFETTNPDTGAVSEYPVSIAVPYEVKAEKNGNGMLRVTLSDGSVFDDLVKLDGDDGEMIRNIAFRDGELRVDTNRDSYGWPIDYRMPTNPTITGDKRLRFEFTDGSSPVQTTERVAAHDGDTITSVTLEDDNSVLIKYTTGNRTGTSEARVPFVRGTGIFDLKIEPATADDDAKLKFKTNDSEDGTDHEIDIPKGVDGYSIEHIRFDHTTGDLHIYHTNPSIDGSTLVESGAQSGLYDLTINDVKGTSIESIAPSVDPDTDEDSIEIALSNDTSVHLPKLEGKDATGILSIMFDAEENKLEIHTTAEAPDDVIVVENFKGIDGDRIESIEPAIDDETGEITAVTLSVIEGASGDTVTYDLPVIRGIDGLGIKTEDGITVDEETTALVINTTDGNSLSWPQQKGVDADWTLTDIQTRTNPEGLPEIVFVDNKGGEHAFAQQKGTDAEESLENIEFDGRDLVVTLIGGETEVVRLTDFKGEDGETITDIKIEDNVLIIETSLLESPLRFEQMVGKDGNSIEDITFDGNDLIITTNVEGKETVEVPAVRGNDGISIEEIEFDSEEARLVITLSDRDEPVVFDQVKGKDGVGIADVRFDQDSMVIELTDESEDLIEIPLVRGSDGDRITNIELVDEEAETYLAFDVSGKDEPVKLPIIKGIDGLTIEDIVVEEDKSLSISTTIPGKETISIDAVKGEDGHGVVSVVFDEDTHTLNIEYTDEELNRTIDIPKAIDGDEITEMRTMTSDPTILEVNTLKGNTYYWEGVFGVDGKNGKNIASITVDDPETGDLVITMDDDTDENGDAVEPTKFVIEGYAKKIETATVNDEQKLEILMSGDDDPIITDGVVVGRDGKGRGIHSAEFEDGILKVTYEDATGVDDEATEIGSVRMNNVKSAEIDEDTGMLTFVMDDDSRNDVGVVYGRDGRFVESIRVDDVEDDNGYVVEKTLVLIMDNGDEITTGNIKGEAGRSIIGIADPDDPESENGIEVLDNGDIIVRYDNGDAEPVGNIGGGVGLAVWEEGNEYGLDRVVIHDGGMYMSAMTENTDEPPSENWKALALGDQIVEVRKPVIESPRNGNVAHSMAPRLIASKYAPIVSGDEREYREFQVSKGTGADFEDAIVYTFTSNSDIHEVRDDLDHSEVHYWRCRDRSERGSFSTWSDVAEFETPEGRVEQPTLSLHGDENANSTFNAPEFIASVFDNRFNAESHAESDWHIVKVVGINDETGEEIVEETLFNVGDTENLEGYIVHYDLLETSTKYRIRVKYRTASIESLWSEWVEFTTEDEFTYINTPAIGYDGSLEEVKAYGPEFKLSMYEKTDRFADKSLTIPMSHTSTDWEVRLLTNNSIVEENFGDTVNLRSYAIQASLNNETRYLIRARFYNERFGYSEWTEWLEFRTLQRIDTPTVSFEDDEIMTGEPIADGTVLLTSEFSAVNETHVATEWRFLDVEDGDSLVYSTGSDTVNLTSYAIDHNSLGGIGDGMTLRVLVRHIGEDINSEYGELSTIIFVDI